MQRLQTMRAQLRQMRDQVQQGVPNTPPSSADSRLDGQVARIFDRRFNVYNLTLLDLMGFGLKQKKNQLEKVQRSLRRMKFFQHSRSLRESMLHRGFEMHPTWVQVCTFVAQILVSPLSNQMFEQGRFLSRRQIDDLGVDPKFNLRRIFEQINQVLQRSDSHYSENAIVRIIHDQTKKGRFMIPVHFTLTGQERLAKMEFIDQKLARRHALQRQIADLQAQFDEQKQRMIRFVARTKAQIESRPKPKVVPMKKNAPVNGSLLSENQESQESQVIEVNEPQVIEVNKPVDEPKCVKFPFQIECKHRTIPSGSNLGLNKERFKRRQERFARQERQKQSKK